MGVIVCFVLLQSYCIYPNLWVSIIGVVDVEISVALEIDTRQMDFTICTCNIADEMWY